MAFVILKYAQQQFMISVIDYESKYQSDFESLNRVWIEKYFTMEPRDEYILTNPDEAILQKGGYIFIALYDNIVAGVVALVKLDSDTYEFSKMGVHEDFRRKGIAEALSHSAFQKAKKLNGRTIILFSNTRLQPAIQLYRKLGFKEVPMDERNEYTRSNIKMELTL
jgi:ribosomal protein S18 acetylase RimI-like enzyme